jgi:hypothetical protein
MQASILRNQGQAEKVQASNTQFFNGVQTSCQTDTCGYMTKRETGKEVGAEKGLSVQTPGCRRHRDNQNVSSSQAEVLFCSLMSPQYRAHSKKSMKIC